MKLAAIVFIAVIVEGLVEYIKLSFPKFAETTWAIFVSTIALGVGAALTFGIDLFEIIGIPTAVPYVGQILTGVIVARGSNYVYDVIGKYTDQKPSEQEITGSVELPEDGNE